MTIQELQDYCEWAYENHKDGWEALELVKEKIDGMACSLSAKEKAKEKSVEEPLAMLAARKGLWMNINHHNNVWAIHFGVKDNVRDPFPTERCLEENSYPAAEREARSWLMAQPDRNEKEGK